ncbi:MAG: hypothetical protein K5705_03720 [Oscillospiraceae bacterium]|nr:hypothetical protein [Oscillospiraceae bacterium]
MNPNEQKEAAEEFVVDWGEGGYEKGQAQLFWSTLLTRVFDLKTNAAQYYFQFEEQVKNERGNTDYIDCFIPSVCVLIEQKSFGKDLFDAFSQAKKYAEQKKIKPRWIVTCDFRTFNIYDIRYINLDDLDQHDCITFSLKDLPSHLEQLSFFTDTSYLFYQNDEEYFEGRFEAIAKKHILSFIQDPGLEDQPYPYDLVALVEEDEKKIYNLLINTFYPLKCSSIYRKIEEFYNAENDYHDFLTSLTETVNGMICVRGVSEEEKERARKLRADAFEKYNNIIFNL